jgi:hypothetical protein
MGRFIKRAQWSLARGNCTSLSKKNYASDPGDFQKKKKIKNYQPLLDCFFFLATNYSIVVASVLHSFELQEFSRVLHFAARAGRYFLQAAEPLFFQNSCVSVQLPPRN